MNGAARNRRPNKNRPGERGGDGLGGWPDQECLTMNSLIFGSTTSRQRRPEKMP